MERGSKPWGWGLPGERYPRNRLDRVLNLLRDRGIEVREARGPPTLPSPSPSELSAGEIEALRNITAVNVDGEERVVHSLGKSYLDLLGLRVGLPLVVTDAVAFPSSVKEVKGLVEWATDRGVSLVPFGGGTSVLGGLKAWKGRHKAVVTVDLRRLNRVKEVDETSMLVVAEAGIRGPEMEEALHSRGLTLGHYPQSFHFSSLGGWIATRSSGHLSGRFGGIEDMVQAVRLVTPRGEIETRSVPARSTGPELKEMIIGSEGSLGFIVEAVLRVHKRPVAKESRVLLFPDFPRALDICRQMVQGGIVPAMIRIADEDEASMILALAGLEAEDVPALVLLEFHGDKREVEASMRKAVSHWVKADAVDIGSETAELWEEEYYRAPYLRDDLLDRGLLVETLETAANWSDLQDLYTAVDDALVEVFSRNRIEGLVLCHLSHAYLDGASLYFTILSPQLPGREMEQWQELKEAATEAILQRGTLSHHHGIGIDHARWLRREHGEIGLRALRALKAAVDPEGIMNPGKLLEEGA